MKPSVPSLSFRNPVRTRDLCVVVIALALLAPLYGARAGSATWKASPPNGDWNTATNWNPATIPNEASDIATFRSSSITNVLVSANVDVDSVVFDSGASAFTIRVEPSVILTISGTGISNNSGTTQTIATTNSANGNGSTVFFTNAASAGNAVFPDADVVFSQTATAGSATFSNYGPGTGSGFGSEEFQNQSTAGNGSFTNYGSTSFSVLPGSISFVEQSSAGNATIINNPGVGGFSGYTAFNESSAGSATAGNATIINNGGVFNGAEGGLTSFGYSSTPGNATLIANSGVNGGGGGQITIAGGRPNGGPNTARVELFGNGSLDIGLDLGRRGVFLGSIEGDGLVFLGNKQLTVGLNNLSTTFTGLIQDGGSNTQSGGSLIKTGKGKLELRGANTYSGGTTVQGGKLQVNNTSSSGTGTGPVQVNSGELGGKGVIAGAVTVGTGSGSGATLSPGYVSGAKRPGLFTIRNSLTLNADAIYQMDINNNIKLADEVVASGITINSGSRFTFVDLGTGTIPHGTVFTVLSNTSRFPIAGTFANLPDGSTFTSKGNTYQANYEGGSGNDLTLTVQ
jgi:autotransporter-associated beta strand protein